MMNRRVRLRVRRSDGTAMRGGLQIQNPRDLTDEDNGTVGRAPCLRRCSSAGSLRLTARGASSDS
jgi:hypothetical protein